MKKVLLSLLAVAALVLSCQNYDDEFAALNAKVASLESQITSLSGLQTALTQVQSSVSALQAAVSAIPNLSSEVAAILEDLGALETAVAAATTGSDLDAFKAELDSTLDALKALIEANSASIADLLTSNSDLKSQLESLGVDVDDLLSQNATYTGNLTITNAAELAFAKSLGSKVKLISGNVKITIGYSNDLTAADVATVSSKIEQVVGNVTLSADHEPIDVSSLVNVSGEYVVEGWDATDTKLATVGGDMYLEYRFPYSFPALKSAKNIYLNDLGKSDGTTKSTTTVEEPIGAQPGVTSVDFLALTSATSIQSASANAGSASSHTSGGSIVFAATPTANTLSLLNAETIKIGDVPVVSLTTRKATAVELHYDATLASLSITDSELATATTEALTSVVIKAKKITGALTLDISKTGSFTAADLADIGGAMTSDALTHSMGSLVTVDGMTLSNATSVSFPKLAIVGDTSSLGVITPANLTVDKVSGTLSLPALTDVATLSADRADSVVAPLATVSTLDIDDAADASVVDIKSLGRTGGSLGTISSTDAGRVETLKIHGQEVTFGATGLNTFTSITSAVIKGEAVSTELVINSNHSELATLELGGKIASAIISTGTSASAVALTSITTSGQIQKLQVIGNADLTSITMGHDGLTAGTTAPTLYVKNNPKLTSLTTSIKSVSVLEVVDNYRLGTLNFSSISTLPANYSASTPLTVHVWGNFANGDEYVAKGIATANPSATVTNAGGRIAYTTGLTGDYRAQTAQVARAYTQTGLATLKPLFALVEAKYDLTTGAVQPALDIDLQYQYDSSAAGATAATATVGTIRVGGTTSSGSTTISGTSGVDNTGGTTIANTVTIADGKALLDEIRAF